MKIVMMSNFDDETVADVLVAENVNEYYGRIIAEALNLVMDNEDTDEWYRMVSDDYVLHYFNN